MESPTTQQVTTEVKEPDNRFYKIRNTGKCLSEGVSLLTEHFLRMVYLSLPISIVYALSSTFIIQNATNTALRTLGVIPPMTLSTSLFTVLNLIASVCSLAFVYRLVELRIANESVKNQTFKSFYNKNFLDLSVKSLFFTIVSAMLFFIACGLIILYSLIGKKEMDLDTTTLKIIGGVVLLLAMLIFSIAYRNVLPTVMLQKGSFVRPYFDGLKKGFRKWGKMMQISVLVFLLVFVVGFLLCAPAIVFSFVQYSAMVSEMNGDAVNLPDHFGTWMFITLFVTSFISFFIMLVYYSPLSFTYASIMTEEEEAEGAIPMV